MLPKECSSPFAASPEGGCSERFQRTFSQPDHGQIVLVNVVETLNSGRDVATTLSLDRVEGIENQ